jgi:hypothetical protein
MNKYQEFSIITTILSLLIISQTDAFFVTQKLTNVKERNFSVCSNVRSRDNVSTMMSFDDFEDSSEDEDDEDDEDDFIDDEALGDWRSFRKDLLETGLTSPESQSTSGEPKEAATSRPKSVSRKNENLLMQQNEKLAEEYIGGVWAHEAPTVSDFCCDFKVHVGNVGFNFA